MLFRVKIAVYSENHTTHINTLLQANAQFSALEQVVHTGPLYFKELCQIRNRRFRNELDLFNLKNKIR
jgi:hypothetical protein